MKLAESNLVELFSNMAVIQEPPQENPSMDTQSSVNIPSYENPFTKWILNLESVIMNPAWSNRDYQFIKETFYFTRKSFERQMDVVFYLGKSMIDTLGTKVPDELTDVSVEWIWSCGFSTLDDQSSLLNDSKSELLELILPYLETDLPVHKQRNLCIFVNLLQKKFSNQLDDNFVDKITEKLENFLIKILSECTHISTLLYAVILLESSYQVSGIIPENDKILKECLFKHTQIESESHLTYQLKLCAQNCLDCLINSPITDSSLSDQSIREVFSRFDRTPFLKLSHDELSVRSDSITFQSYQCSAYQTCPSGKRFYYEVTLNTSGPMRIGWSSKTTTTLDGIAIGSDKHSIGYDGHRKWVWVNNRTYQIADESTPRWKAGDVVGCYLDLSQEPKQKFYFYLNGRLLETFREFDILAKVYFPAVSLSLHQQCKLNFGAKQFQLSVPDEFFNFYQESIKIKENFQKEMQKTYQEKFPGQLLSDFDLLLLELEWKISSDFNSRKNDWKYFHKELPESFHLLIRNHKENYLTQLIKSVINIIGTKAESNSNFVNVLIGTLIKLISSLEDELISLSDFTNLVKSYLINKNEIPDLIKQRNICISYLILSSKFLNQNLSDEFVNFLLKIFSENQDDGLSKLFALVILSNDEKVFEKLRDQNGKFYKNLFELADKNFDKIPVNSLYLEGFNFIGYQIGFISNWILNANNDKTCLDLIKCSDKIKISSDCLSVRNDYYEWENVYYRGYSFAESRAYFFEVILLSSGSMRIGWASVDDKEDLISELISFDGRIRFLWKEGQDGVPYQDLEPWKGGDVIGCLIEIDDDKDNLTTIFYHNGRSICRNTSDKIILSSRSYFPSISLSPYQQVYLNFGQAPFQFPTEKLTKNSTTVKPISSLHPSTGPHAEFCQLCHVRPHQVQFSRCNHCKFCLACVGKVAECPTCAGINVSDNIDEQ